MWFCCLTHSFQQLVRHRSRQKRQKNQTAPLPFFITDNVAISSMKMLSLEEQVPVRETALHWNEDNCFLRSLGFWFGPQFNFHPLPGQTTFMDFLLLAGHKGSLSRWVKTTLSRNLPMSLIQKDAAWMVDTFARSQACFSFAASKIMFLSFQRQCCR